MKKFKTLIITSVVKFNIALLKESNMSLNPITFDPDPLAPRPISSIQTK